MRRALLALLVAASLAAGCGGGGEEIAALPAGSFVSASGSLGPPIHLFGDTITADVSVVVDRTKLDPAQLSLKTSFEPYEPIEEMEVAAARRETSRRFATGFGCAASSARASPRPWARSRIRAERPAHLPLPARAGAVHRSGRGESPAPSDREVQPGRVGHAHQRAGRDAGVRLPLPWQRHAAAGDLAAHVADDARPDPAAARGRLARVARHIAPSLVA